MKTGIMFAFLEVDINPLLSFYTSRLDEYCCVLRLDLTTFTVSTIVEIVEANFLVTLKSVFDVDIAYYNETAISNTQGVIKIYFDESWISFNQTSRNNSVETYHYDLIFSSESYNFASAYKSSITFNVSTSVFNTS
jgi:hypothetical protein